MTNLDKSFSHLSTLGRRRRPTRRLDLGLANGVLAVAFLLRLITGTTETPSWLRCARQHQIR